VFRTKRHWRLVAHAFVAVLWLGFLIELIRERHEKQLDFRTYYYACKTWEQGLDPYDLSNLARVSDGEVKFPFFYPPVTLYLFRLFSWMPYEAASTLWLITKLASLAALVAIWKRHFLSHVDSVLLSVTVLLGFNAAVGWDLKAGNVSILEQLLLWMGFACYLREQQLAAAVFIVLGAVFKLTPAVFLGLLLLPRPTVKSCALVVAGVAALCLLCFVPFAWRPELGHSFLGNAMMAREIGVHNPCALAFIDALRHDTHFAALAKRLPLLPTLLWVGYVVTVAGFSLRPLLGLVVQRDRPGLLLLLAIIYALLVPRFKSYSYILLIPPALMLAYAARHTLSPITLAAFLLCLPEYCNPYPKLGHLDGYYPWVLTLGMWVVAIVTLRQRCAGSPKALRQRPVS